MQDPLTLQTARDLAAALRPLENDAIELRWEAERTAVARDALEEQNRTFVGLTDTTNDGHLVTDLFGTFRDANQGLARG